MDVPGVKRKGNWKFQEKISFPVCVISIADGKLKIRGFHKWNNILWNFLERHFQTGQKAKQMLTLPEYHNHRLHVLIHNLHHFCGLLVMGVWICSHSTDNLTHTNYLWNKTDQGTCQEGLKMCMGKALFNWGGGRHAWNDVWGDL